MNPVPYPGSKGQLASWIIDQFPEHYCYVEPFSGGATVLFSKEPSQNEIINDNDGDIIHFYETLREKEHELTEWLRNHPFSRDLHKEYGDLYYKGYRPVDDVERAGRWFYLRNTQFAQKYDLLSGFRLAQANNHAEQFQKRVNLLHETADRLRQVQIENLDYEDLMRRVDKPNTLFYADPPYIEEGDDLYTGDAFDHERFVDVLEDMDGYWVVSYTDLPERLEDGDYVVKSQSRRVTLRNGYDDFDKENEERIVMNFDPDDVPSWTGESSGDAMESDW